MKMTKVQFIRAETDFKSYAKSNSIKVSFRDFRFFVECSEVEMYRILDKYNFGFSSAGNLFIKNNNIIQL